MQSNQIRFSRPLRSVVLAGSVPVKKSAPVVPPLPVGASEQEKAAQAEALAYARGFEEATRQAAETQAEDKATRAKALDLLLKKLEGGHETLVTQVGRVLPKLVVEAVRRVLAGAELPSGTVVGIINELLGEVHPGSGALEILLNEHDLHLLKSDETLIANFAQSYPGITFAADRHLLPGDCLLRSRFGTIDGRVAAKMENLEELLQ